MSATESGQPFRRLVSSDRIPEGSESFKRRNAHLFAPSAPIEDKPATDRHDSEKAIHEKIAKWCDSQWPRWKYYHSRMDKPSTLPLGAPDFVIFGQHPICLLVECKDHDGKLSGEQMNWIKEMEMLGWPVHVVRSFEQFLNLISYRDVLSGETNNNKTP